VDLGLAFAPAGLAVAPDGARAYAFDALSDDLVQIDLAAGRLGVLAWLPGSRPWGLAVTANRLYAAGPPGGEVWVVDRAAGRRAAALRAGGAPVGIGLGP
jgi:DNA-binding beta-propeller fold protein YncE